jgi:hypothetical protein
MCRPERVLLLSLLLLLASPLRAHDIPQRVAAFLFVKPEGKTLNVVLRVPLETMRDINFPLKQGEMLDISKATPLLDEGVKLWIVDHVAFYENGVRLATPRVVSTRISLPNDRAFTVYDRAVAHVTRDAALDDTVDVPWRQAMLDVMLTVPVASPNAHFAFEPTLGSLGLHTTSIVHFLPSGGAERVFTFDGNPGKIALDPAWYDAARHFMTLGITHILSGLDHLLFVLCLVIPIRRMRALVGIITAFTAAHSITLLASAAGFAPDALWFPPLIEVLIAISIVYMAFENMVARPKALERRWMLAFGFGLVHGFAFSFALRESLQFAGSHLLAALLSFNVGVEIGQLLVLAVAVPLLAVIFKSVSTERAGVLLLSALVAHTAWHWMLDRGAVLGQYRLEAPQLDLAFAAAALRGVMLLMVIGGVAWVMSRVVRTIGASSSLLGMTPTSRSFATLRTTAGVQAPSLHFVQGQDDSGRPE